MKPQLKKLPYKAIKVQGWLKNQLLLQAQGLSGNIQNLFLDVGSSSAWLGGKGEAWERGPYYLDGIVPLAFLLNDKPLLKTVFFWVEKILESKNSQVGFGPLRNNDYWPRMVVQKALISFYRTTSDKRIIPFLLDYYKFMSNEINKHPYILGGGKELGRRRGNVRGVSGDGAKVCFGAYGKVIRLWL